MAEINVERKTNKKPVWPWLLGLLILIGVIWAIAASTNDPERVEMAEEEQFPVLSERVADRPEEGEIDAFVSYVQNENVQQELGLNPVITSEALLRLSGSLEVLAGPEHAYVQQINQIRTSAEQLQIEPAPDITRQAELAYSGFTSAATVLELLQEEHFPDAESNESQVEEVQEIVGQIDPTKILAEQQDKVLAYFQKTAEAVDKMQEEVPERSNN